MAAVVDIAAEVRGCLVAHQVERRGEDQVVAGKVGFGVGEVHADAVVPQDGVEGLDPFAVVKVAAGAPFQVLRPERLHVPEDGHAR